MENPVQDPLYEEALRHVRNVRSFYVHALVFTLVNAGFLALHAMSGATRPWFGWTTLGWGLGLALHGASVFVFRGWLGADWERRQVRAYLERRS